MRIAPTGRVIFVIQWVAAVALPIFFFLGRGIVGARVAMIGVYGLQYGPVAILLLLLPPLLTLLDAEVRQKRATRLGFDIAAVVSWVALIVAALAVPDYDMLLRPAFDSALSNWAGVSDESSSAILYSALAVCGLAYLTQVAIAIAGIVRRR